MKPSRFLLVSVMLFLVLLPLAGYGAEEPGVEYFIDEAKLPFTALEGTVTTRHYGVHEGAGYRIEVPEDWNGDLVLYCHGYRGGAPELTVTNPRIRHYLVTNGYAWAASSYSTNGYDVKSGVLDTYALTKVFWKLVDRPRRTYITGHSMGGHVVGVAIETFPWLFDGALPMCGVMGDCELFDYSLDFQVLAQYLTATDVDFPWPEDYSDAIVPKMQTQLGGEAGFPVSLSEAGVKLRTAVKYLSGGRRPLYDMAFAAWGNFLFGQGLVGDIGIASGNVMDNRKTIYQLDDDPALSEEEKQLNKSVLRVAAEPEARKSPRLSNIPKISGKIRMPVLTLHTLGDLFVPFSMQQIYAERVRSWGRSHLLVQRAIRDVQHCAFNVEEEQEAFSDLVDWVANGRRPEGDDILDAETVAAPDFGCKFTVEPHTNIPADCGE